MTACPRCGGKPRRGRIGHDRACPLRHQAQGVSAPAAQDRTAKKPPRAHVDRYATTTTHREDHRP